MEVSIPINLLLNPSKTNTIEDKPSTRRFWPVPPMEASLYEYQNINKDINLRKNVTQFYHKKLLEWINTDNDFKHLKNQYTNLDSLDGQMIIYKLLRHFVKKSGINWFDLRDNHQLIKKYLSKKIE